MKLEIGEEIIIPIKPEHHFKNTGVLCKIKEIHSSIVYVSKFNEINNTFNKHLVKIDKFFLEKHKDKLKKEMT